MNAFTYVRLCFIDDEQNESLFNSDNRNVLEQIDAIQSLQKLFSIYFYIESSKLEQPVSLAFVDV